jgi:hypothetical protein
MTSKVGLIPIPFTDGFYQTRSRSFSSARTINWYVNIPSAKALNDRNLYPTPGLAQVVEAVGGINRGSWLMNRKAFFVNGQGLYRLDRSVDANGDPIYSAALIGTILGSGDVIMAAVKTQLCIVVPGQYAYIYIDGGALAQITDPDFDGPVDDVAALASVFVFVKTGSNKIFHSALNNGLAYNALDFYTVNQMDICVGLMAYRNILYVMGESNIVPFVNTGGLQFLFSPQPNSVIPTGLRSNYAKTTFKDSFVWMGSGENEGISIYMYAGGQPQKISTEPIDYLLQNSPDEEIEQAKILRHSQNGANFIVLSVGDYCLVYDLTASQLLQAPAWHERRSSVEVDGEFIDSPWRAKSIVQAYNRVFVGDALDGRIGEIQDDIGTEYGAKMRRVWESAPLSNMGVKTKVKALEVFTDVGVAPDDVINLSWSDDGGFTWSNKADHSLGAIGEYGQRVFWSRLGAFSIARKLRLEYSGEYPRSINNVMGNAN